MKEVTLLFFIALIFVASSIEVIKGRKYESLLLDAIFKDYDKRIRPVEDNTLAVVVNFSLTFQQILQVDEKHQTLTSNVLRTFYWKDDFLKWNPEIYGNISQISVIPNTIWTPDIQLYNAASFDKEIGRGTRNVISKDGLVADALPMVLKSTCKIDVTWFPFDDQKCLLMFGSWSLPAKHLVIQLNEFAIDVNNFVDNGEWKLVAVTAANNSLSYLCCPDDSYIRITYTIHLKRRTFYYFFNLIVPCGLIGFLAILGFTLPPESGEKLPLGASILFSLIVFLNMITESMPANSDAVPLLGTYFNCVMFTIALSVVSTIVVNLNAANTKGVKGLSKKVFLHWLPWIVHMDVPQNIALHKENMQSSKNKIKNAISLDFKRTDRMCSVCTFGMSADKIVAQQWRFIAAVIDRMCLMLSLIVTFVSVTVFLIYAF